MPQYEKLTEKATSEVSDSMNFASISGGKVGQTPWSKMLETIKTKISSWVFNTLNTTNKTLPGAVNELNAKFNFVTKEISATVTFTDGYCSKVLDVTYAGYKPIGILGISARSTYFGVSAFGLIPNANQGTVIMRHITTPTYSGTAEVVMTVLYMPI